jgi:ribonuclease HI
MQLTIHTDGGARGNPGPAGIGVVIEAEEQLIHEFGKTIGETTNNIAEYTAVVEALTWLKENKEKVTEYTSLSFFLDSTLVVNQLNGLFKIKEAHLKELVMKVHILEQEVGKQVNYTAVRREFNKRADMLVNQALDVQGA